MSNNESVSNMERQNDQENQRKTNQTQTAGGRTPRPPKSTTQSRVAKNRQELTVEQNEGRSGNDSDPSLPKLSSGLSVAAVAFIPKNTSLRIEAPEFVPGGTSYVHSDGLVSSFGGLELQDPAVCYSEHYTTTGSPIIDRFVAAMEVVNMSPGNLKEYFAPICEIIEETSPSVDVANTLVESLFEQSIQVPNFRYTGARICQFLATHLNKAEHFQQFNKRFINRCKREFDVRETLINGSEEAQQRLGGLAMFMAEIFLNVQTLTPDGSLERLHFLPEVLIQLVKTLLSKPVESNVKCSCQLLKLSGALIEDIVKNDPKQCIEFEEIFKELHVLLNQQPQPNSNLSYVIKSVLDLKESDWRRTESLSTKNSLVSFPGSGNALQSQEPTFFDREGKPYSRLDTGADEFDSEGNYVLTEEEEAFLEWQMEHEASNGPMPSNWNDSEFEAYRQNDHGEEEGMGDEIEAAYEEFLQEQSGYSAQNQNQTVYQPRQYADQYHFRAPTAPTHRHQHNQHNQHSQHPHHQNMFPPHQQQQQQQQPQQYAGFPPQAEIQQHRHSRGHSNQHHPHHPHNPRNQYH